MSRIVLPLGIILTAATAMAFSPVRAASPSRLVTSASGHGVRLTVSFPRHPYPLGQEAVAAVRLTNLTGRPIPLKGDPFICLGANPAVIPVTADGRTSYPNPDPGPYCPMHPTHAIPARRTLVTTIHFTLGRPWVVGQVTILLASRHGAAFTLRTPLLRLPTRGNAVIPPCHIHQGYPAGYCVDPPNVMSIPGGWLFQNSLIGWRASYRRYGDVIVKAAAANPMINDRVPETVYGQILVGGKPVSGIRMTAVWRYRGGMKVCRPFAGAHGIASCSEPALAFQSQDNQRIPIEVAFAYHHRTYTVQTTYEASVD
ncbi:MAG TPA: hypothetical protein VFB58_13705 [Chloroflexota bacterium]|nr:hypothetical protein [Chloroflexota bacterium]